ncbi:MAG: NusG domain II-containing protein [Lachnospiraceae bacterium]|nr:NusG domain II-containing protein [Lachnospiraceae bacterium]
MKKADIKLILAVCILCAVFFIYRSFTQDTGKRIVVEVDGTTWGTYSLSRNQTIEINDTNVLIIKDGEAYMSEASCPDGLCISQGHISNTGEMIVCLPNRVVVYVADDEEEDDDGLDAVTG